VWQPCELLYLVTYKNADVNAELSDINGVQFQHHRTAERRQPSPPLLPRLEYESIFRRIKGVVRSSAHRVAIGSTIAALAHTERLGMCVTLDCTTSAADVRRSRLPGNGASQAPPPAPLAPLHDGLVKSWHPPPCWNGTQPIRVSLCTTTQ